MANTNELAADINSTVSAGYYADLAPSSTTTFSTTDSYSGRSHQSTLTDASHASERPIERSIQDIEERMNTFAMQGQPQHHGHVDQESQSTRALNNTASDYSTRIYDDYDDPRTSHRENSHKKLYSIDSGGKSRVVADIDINSSHESSHRRPDIDRSWGRHSLSWSRDNSYHLDGFSVSKGQPMYRETESRWRHLGRSAEVKRARPSSALISRSPRPKAGFPGPPTSHAHLQGQRYDDNEIIRLVPDYAVDLNRDRTDTKVLKADDTDEEHDEGCSRSDGSSILSGASLRRPLEANSSDSDSRGVLSRSNLRKRSARLAHQLCDPILDAETSKTRRWLLKQLKPEMGGDTLRDHLEVHTSFQRQVTVGEDSSSTSNFRTTSSLSQLPPLLTSSTESASSRKPSGRGRRREEDSGDEDGQGKRRYTSSRSTNEITTARFACLYNKYDPMMYRSNKQSHKKFEICQLHDFKDMNKLYEHMKRVHGDQPPQCPRCARTGFASSEELQAHQTAMQPCTLVPVATVRRIRWITQEQLKVLQAEINRTLRGLPEEEKWRFAYRWLFPDAISEDTPSPYMQDSVISIVSSVIDDYEQRLLDLIRQSDDLDDLESRISSIRGQFLAQYGVSTDHDDFSSSNSRTSSDSSSQISNTRTPSHVFQSDQPRIIVSGSDHDQLAFPSTSNDPSSDHDFTSYTFLQAPLAVSEDLGWQQNNSFATSMNDLFNLPMVHESSNTMDARSDISEPFTQANDVAGFGV